MSMKKGGNFFNLVTKGGINLEDSNTIPNILSFSYKTSQNTTNNSEKSTKDYFYNKKLQLYKTEICRSHSEIGYCKYGSKCQFAHDITELRNVNRHPRYKTETCRTFWEEGSCPYGKRCCFIHIKNTKPSPVDIKIDDKCIINNKTDEYKSIISDIDYPKLNKEEDNMFSSIEACDNNKQIEKYTPHYDMINASVFVIDKPVDINNMRYDLYNSDSDEIETCKLDNVRDCTCKDYDISEHNQIQREWSDKQIKLTETDSIFINSLLVNNRVPFWETNENILWTKSPLFYTINNHKWK